MRKTQLSRLGIGTALLALAAASLPALAQERRWAISPTVGYRFGGTTSSSGNTYIDKLTIDDTVSFGLTGEYLIHPNATVEFLWSHQDTQLSVDWKAAPPPGYSDRYTHLNVDTFQVGGLWQSGREGDAVRGYFDLLFGMSILTPAPQYSTISRFSISIGGGAKFRLSDSMGVRLGLRWQPIYINSSDSGYVYCDPYWGCYNYYNQNYIYQTDANLGLTFKF